MRKKLSALVPVLALVCSLLGVFVPAVMQQHASAAVNATWINRVAINNNGQIFMDNNTFDDNYSYIGDNPDSCPNANQIIFTRGPKQGANRNSTNPQDYLAIGGAYTNGGPGFTPGGNTYFYYTPNFNQFHAWLETNVRRNTATTTQCDTSYTEIHTDELKNWDFRRITFVYTTNANSTIQDVMQPGITFDAQPNRYNGAIIYARNGDPDATCRDLIVNFPDETNQHEIIPNNSQPGSESLYAVQDQPGTKKVSESYKFPSGGITQPCYIAWDDNRGAYPGIEESGYGLTSSIDPHGEGQLVANGIIPENGGGLRYDTSDQGNDDTFIIYVGNAAQNLQPTPVTPPSATGGATQDISCEGSGASLGWLLCGISDALAGLSDWLLNTFVIPLLQPTPIGLNPTDSVSGKTYQIWAAFRTYGNIILVIALIVAVISQAMGGGIVEAYTARKMLPRILTSAILVNISIYIVAFSVDISRLVGSGIQGIITAPLGTTGNLVLAIGNVQGDIIGGVIILLIGAAFAAGAFTLAFLPFILLFVLLPAILAIVGIFITAILLQGLIIALIIFAPVAFALYCLPNTEKYFKTWWDWFFRALLVYPIITAIIGITKVMTVMIIQANQ